MSGETVRSVPAPASPRTPPAGTAAARRGRPAPAVVDPFTQRARYRRRLTRRKALLAVAGAATVVATAWVTFFSPALALDPARIVVTGAGTVVAGGDVTAVLEQYVGTPLPRLDTIGLRDDLLDVPGVREVRVMRDWPRGLTVTLVSREPVAAVPADDGVSLVDTDGVRVGHADAAPQGLPLVDVPLEDSLTLGAVLQVLAGMDPALAAEVTDVAATSRDDVVLTLSDGLSVEWGSAEKTALKSSLVQTLRSSGATAGASVVDVSAPTMPVVR